MTDTTIAQTILEQLGGRRFALVTGAKNFAASENALHFRLPGAGGFTKNGINAVKVELMPSDTYTVTFSRIRGAKRAVLHVDTDVYAEDLRPIFSERTGLVTGLGTLVVRAT